MTNINAPFFTSLSQQDIVDKQKAELYMQLYPYMAEDFLSSFDAQTYGKTMQMHIQNLQKQIDRLMEVISNHTHVLPPHIHIATKEGAPTTVETGPLITQVPTQKPVIKWVTSPTPVPVNQTGSVWNISGNLIITGVPSDGMAKLGKRRALPLPLTLEIVLPPILSANIGGL